MEKLLIVAILLHVKEGEMMSSEFIMKRAQNYFWERTLVEVVKRPVRFLVNTPITPNMVTVTNMILNTGICCYLAINNKYVLTALFIQIYMLCDVLDGNLARNKKMCSSLGKRLDQISDFLFFTVFFLVLGWNMDIPFWWAICAVLMQNIYGLIATFYIAPFIRKSENFKRTKLKQYFYDRGILFGMDVTLQCLVSSIFLLTPYRNYLFLAYMGLWLIDLIYRLYEIKQQ